MGLRPYQQRCHDAVMEWVSRSIEPCLVEAATGAGKSHIIASVAESIHQASGLSVLATAPSAELVEQNRSKYAATGSQSSVFSASLGRKCTRHPVVFGTPKSVANNIERFGSQYAAIVIDEAHGVTPTIRGIVESVRGGNPNVRVIGLTATPYRLGSGYIYATNPDGSPVAAHRTRDPYFTRLVERVPAHELIQQGYLTPPNIGNTDGRHYDTGGLELSRTGQFTASSVSEAFEGRGRLTSQIVADIRRHALGRMGVMIFASTIPHAEEVMASLSPSDSALITGKTGTAERRRIIERFKAGGFKYLVNVDVLTTGFDADHVDLIAILRRTESAGLLQQMIGRGLRLHPAKTDCLVLDYAENLENHCPHGDVFDPDIKAWAAKGEPETIPVLCPECGAENQVAKRDDWEGESDEYGYAVGSDGERLEPLLPAHLGRRCQGIEINAEGRAEQCEYRWASKPCEECGGDNDVAARRCEHCGAEIIDPNEKLRLEYTKMKRDPYSVSTDKVLEWSARKHISAKGNECCRIDWRTEYRRGSFFLLEGKDSGALKALGVDCMDNAHRAARPNTITYVKSSKNGFFRLLGINHSEDEAPHEIP